MQKGTRLFFSTAFRQHSEINPASPNALLRLSPAETLFAKRIGFSVDDSLLTCHQTEGSIVSPHFIIQTLTHKSYRDGAVPCNDKLVLLGLKYSYTFLGRAFFETLPIAGYVENLKDPANVSIKDLLLQTQGNMLVQKGIAFLDIQAVARWDIVLLL